MDKQISTKEDNSTFVAVVIDDDKVAYIEGDLDTDGKVNFKMNPYKTQYKADGLATFDSFYQYPNVTIAANTNKEPHGGSLKCELYIAVDNSGTDHFVCIRCQFGA